MTQIIKTLFTISIWALFSLNIAFAQCNGLDSDSADAFLSLLKEKAEPSKQSTNETIDIKIGNEIVILTENLEIDSIDTVAPDSLLTWGMGFSEGMAKITVKGKSGFINSNGEVQIRPIYEAANCFSEGLAPVMIKDKWGFIDKNGEVIIPAKFDYVASFSESLALVKVGRLWGYINKTGDFVIEPKFEEARSFVEGVANVGFYDKNYVWMSNIKRTGKFRRGFIDKNGDWVIQATDGAYDDFNGGMAIVSRSIGYSEKYKGMISETYIIDKQGIELWKLNSSLVTKFSEGFIVVAVSRDEKTKRDKYSFLNKQGKRVTEKSFDNMSSFSEGLAIVKVGKFSGFINTKGKLVIPIQLLSAGGFSEGLAYVYNRFGKCGFIDRKGNWIIKSQFDWSDSFKEGKAAVSIRGEIGYIDRIGNFIWKTPKK